MYAIRSYYALLLAPYQQRAPNPAIFTAHVTRLDLQLRRCQGPEAVKSLKTVCGHRQPQLAFLGIEAQLLGLQILEGGKGWRQCRQEGQRALCPAAALQRQQVLTQLGPRVHDPGFAGEQPLVELHHLGC